MSNKQIIKKVFDEVFDRKKMRQQILLKYERKEKLKMNKIMKYAIVPIGLILAVFVGISFNRENEVLEEKNKGIIKMYAYTMSENEELEKKELKENIKLGLTSYNSAMSSVPGYPIGFEIDNMDLIKINVNNGTIFDWNKEAGEVKKIGSTYELSNNKILYFQVNEKTNIRIIGISNKEEVFEKNITISKDDNFNYYATMK